MGIPEIGVLGLTALILLVNVLAGLNRGRNRAILKLVLTVVCGVIVFFLRGTIADIIKNIEINGKTIGATINEALGSSLPAGMEDLIQQIIEIMLGVVCFIVCFIVLQLLISIIIYPICKIFIKKEDKDKNKGLPDVMPNGKKRKPKLSRGMGALFGLVKGILVSIILIAPISGLASTAVDVASIEIEKGKPLFDVSAYGLDTYSESIPAKVYEVTGGWLFKGLLSNTDENGNTLDLSGIKDIAETASVIVSEVDGLSSTIETITSGSDTVTASTFTNLGDSLERIGQAINDLPDNAMQLLDDLSTVVLGFVQDSGSLPDGLTLPEDLKFSDLNVSALGTAVKGLAPILGAAMGGGDPTTVTLTADNAQNIVDGLAENGKILDLVTTLLGGDSGGGSGEPVSLPLSSAQQNVLNTALTNNTSISAETKASLKTLFGIE